MKLIDENAQSAALLSINESGFVTLGDTCFESLYYGGTMSQKYYSNPKNNSTRLKKYLKKFKKKYKKELEAMARQQKELARLYP